MKRIFLLRPIFLPSDMSEFKVHENGLFLKTSGKVGASLYYANTTQMGEKLKEKYDDTNIHKGLCRMISPLP